MQPIPEVRFYHGGVAEFREDSATGEIIVTGTPIVYNTPYTVTDMFGDFTERMNPSVGQDAIARGFDVRLLENHAGLPYARTKPANGKPATLALEHVPGVGLRMVAKLDGNAPRVQDLLSTVERGDAGEMSCGFIVEQDQWNEDWTDREILRFRELLDVSIVTFPASPTTSVQVAQRMLGDLTPKTLARVRKMLAVDRAGKVLSDANQEHVVNAAKALHAVLLASGFDPADLLEDGTPTNTELEDGSDGGDTGSGNGSGDGGAEDPDGSGVFRAEDLNRARELRARALRARTDHSQDRAGALLARVNGDAA